MPWRNLESEGLPPDLFGSIKGAPGGGSPGLADVAETALCPSSDVGGPFS